MPLFLLLFNISLYFHSLSFTLSLFLLFLYHTHSLSFSTQSISYTFFLYIHLFLSLLHIFRLFSDTLFLYSFSIIHSLSLHPSLSLFTPYLSLFLWHSLSLVILYHTHTHTLSLFISMFPSPSAFLNFVVLNARFLSFSSLIWSKFSTQLRIWKLQKRKNISFNHKLVE